MRTISIYWERVFPWVGAIALFIVGVGLCRISGPFYAAQRVDPSYAYLLNSLAIAKGLHPMLIQHPGTTVEELGALSILINWAFLAVTGVRQPIVDSVLIQPEMYLHAINAALLTVDAFAIAIAIRLAIKATGKVWPSLAALILILTCSTVLDSLADAKPETLLIAPAILVIALALPVEATDEWAYRFRAILLGLVAGAGVTTKMTFAPLLLFVFVWPGIELIVLSILSAVFAFAALTFPIWRSLLDVAVWLQQLLTHQGTYGEGPTGFRPIGDLLAGFLHLLFAEPITGFAILSVGIALAVLWRRPKGEEGQWVRFFLIGGACILCQLLIVAPRPNPRYLLPGIVVSAIFMPLAFYTFARTSKPVGWFFRVGILTVTMGLAAYGMGTSVANIRDIQSSEIAFAHIQSFVQRAHCREVPYYAFTSKEYALIFGRNFAPKSFSKEMKRLYPDYVTYHIWRYLPEDMSGVLENGANQELLKRSGHICLVGSANLDNWQHLELKRIDKEGIFSVYELLAFH